MSPLNSHLPNQVMQSFYVHLRFGFEYELVNENSVYHYIPNYHNQSLRVNR